MTISHMIIIITELQVPTRLEKDKMKESAQLDERYKVSILIGHI